MLHRDTSLPPLDDGVGLSVNDVTKMMEACCPTAYKPLKAEKVLPRLMG
jgi:hypothetical protein